MEKQEYTIKQAAEVLGISESGVRRRIRENVLESHRDDGRIMVVMSDEDIKKIKTNANRNKPGPKGKKKAPSVKAKKPEKATEKELTTTIDKLAKKVGHLTAEVRVCKQEIEEINNRKLWWWLFKR